MIEQYKLTQDDVAEKIGKSRPAIANTLRLLLLPEQIIALVESNKISAGHARALLGVENVIKQKEIALMIVQNNLSVRDVENLIKKLNKPAVSKPVVEKSLELKDFENKIKQTFATKVQIKGTDTKGKIVIEYYSADERERLIDYLIEQ